MKKLFRKIYISLLRQSKTKVLSFPKSGRTWLRLMLTRYIVQLRGRDTATETDLQLLSFLNWQLPAIQFVHGTANKRQPFWDFGGMRSLVRGRRVVSLVRDPRDTIVSYYHHKKSRDGEYEGSLSEFLREPEYGFVRLLSYLSAQTTVVAEEAESSVLISYEAMHNDPGKVFADVLTFLGIDVQQELIDEAVEYTQFDKVQAKERAGKLDNATFGVGADGTAASYKARKGKVGSYKEEMSQEDILWCNTLMEAMLPPSLQHYLAAG